MKTKLNLPKEATFTGPAVLWKRALAFLIDIIILDFVVGFPLRRVFVKVAPVGDFSLQYSYFASNPKAIALLSLIMVVYGLLALLYFAIPAFNRYIWQFRENIFAFLDLAKAEFIFISIFLIMFSLLNILEY